MNRAAYVYILASQRNGTLYIGVTANLVKRVWEHRASLVAGFAEKHDAVQLVYYERSESIESAIHREKCLKRWRRQWKLDLVESFNPYWRDLYRDIT